MPLNLAVTHLQYKSLVQALYVSGSRADDGYKQFAELAACSFRAADMPWGTAGHDRFKFLKGVYWVAVVSVPIIRKPHTLLYNQNMANSFKFQVDSNLV